MSDFDYIRMPLEDTAKKVVDKWWELSDDVIELVGGNKADEMIELIEELDIQITANQTKS